MKKGQATIWIGITVSLIFMVLVISILFNMIQDQTISTAVADDQFTGSNNTCIQVTDDCIGSLTSVADPRSATNLSNATACVPVSTYTQGILLTPGTGNEEFNGDTLNATYTGVSCQRLTGVTSTLVNYIPLLLALATLAFVAFMVKT